MKTNIHIRPHLAQFFLERQMFRNKCVEKIKTHILSSITFFFRKYYPFWHNVEKNVSVKQATHNIINP